MRFAVPPAQQCGHEARHAQRRRAMCAGGEVGEVGEGTQTPARRRAAGGGAGRGGAADFADALIERAAAEDAVIHPAAVLVGQALRQRLGAAAAVPG